MCGTLTEVIKNQLVKNLHEKMRLPPGLVLFVNGQSSCHASDNAPLDCRHLGHVGGHCVIYFYQKSGDLKEIRAMELLFGVATIEVQKFHDEHFVTTSSSDDGVLR